MSATIEYVPNPRQPTDAENWDSAPFVFGAYKVRFDDNFTVLIPHTGWLNTVSQTPLDIEDDEHRAIILEQADRMRMEHHTKADLDVLPIRDETDA